MTAMISAGTTRLLSLAIVSFGLILAPFRAEAQAAAPGRKSSPTAAGNSENGKKLFTSYGCYECHGHHAEGSSAAGPRLGPNAISLQALVKYVRQPTGQMPPYTSKVVSDAELADIYAFLQSLPRAPKADALPALK